MVEIPKDKKITQEELLIDIKRVLTKMNATMGKSQAANEKLQKLKEERAEIAVAKDRLSLEKAHIREAKEEITLEKSRIQLAAMQRNLLTRQRQEKAEANNAYKESSLYKGYQNIKGQPTNFGASVGLSALTGGLLDPALIQTLGADKLLTSGLNFIGRGIGNIFGRRKIDKENEDAKAIVNEKLKESKKTIESIDIPFENTIPEKKDKPLQTISHGKNKKDVNIENLLRKMHSADSSFKNIKDDQFFTRQTEEMKTIPEEDIDDRKRVTSIDENRFLPVTKRLDTLVELTTSIKDFLVPEEVENRKDKGDSSPNLLSNLLGGGLGKLKAALFSSLGTLGLSKLGGAANNAGLLRTLGPWGLISAPFIMGAVKGNDWYSDYKEGGFDLANKNLDDDKATFQQRFKDGELLDMIASPINTISGAILSVVDGIEWTVTKMCEGFVFAGEMIQKAADLVVGGVIDAITLIRDGIEWVWEKLKLIPGFNGALDGAKNVFNKVENFVTSVFGEEESPIAVTTSTYNTEMIKDIVEGKVNGNDLISNVIQESTANSNSQPNKTSLSIPNALDLSTNINKKGTMTSAKMPVTNNIMNEEVMKLLNRQQAMMEQVTNNTITNAPVNNYYTTNNNMTSGGDSSVYNTGDSSRTLLFNGE